MSPLLDVANFQARLVALGYDVGPAGADGRAGKLTKAAIEAFQRDHGLVVDGVVGRDTAAALLAAAPAGSGSVVSADWMPAARINRIIVHWTAGAHTPSGLDKSHYHILIDGSGALVRGRPSIALNDAGGTRAGYAAHTLNANSGSIGVALCGMAGAVERPFSAGPFPLQAVQWTRLATVCADLCRRYGIAVQPGTVLSHAEVQQTLGIRQRGKWDISRLPFNPSIVGATACGNALRAAVSAIL